MYRDSFLKKLRKNPVSLRWTSLSNAISVPGRRHTATLGSPTSANPCVVVFQNCVETSLSPTLAGRDAASCSLQSPMVEELLSIRAPPARSTQYEKFAAKSWNATVRTAYEPRGENSQSATHRDCGCQFIRQRRSVYNLLDPGSS